jgi:sec-independent protein translocase protein TatA
VFEGLFQPAHLLVILVIFMVMFGGKKLPELGRGLGQAIRGFKSEMDDGKAEGDEAVKPRAELGRKS